MDWSWLQKGYVIRRYFSEIENPKMKMGVIVGLDTERATVIFVLINSFLTKRARSKPELRDRHVHIDPSSYPCLRQMSHVNCTSVIEVAFRPLVEEVSMKEWIKCGALSSEHSERVLAEIQKARQVGRRHKRIAAAPLTSRSYL